MFPVLYYHNLNLTDIFLFQSFLVLLYSWRRRIYQNNEDDFRLKFFNLYQAFKQHGIQTNMETKGS